MCGRYYVNEETSRDIEGLVNHIEKKMRAPYTGDIYPSEAAIIVAGIQPGLTAREMRWGFPQSSGKGLLINARAETVTEKKTFRDSVLKRRCVIPAKHFYEWDSDKNKVTFLMPENRTVYMAGFYRNYGEEERFMIITTQANETVSMVHDRMPLLLSDDEIEDWIYNDGHLNELLGHIPPVLIRYKEFEQQTLALS